MLDTTTQAIAVADTPQLLTFNTTGIADKIDVTSSSRFTVKENGVYLLNADFQLTSTTANKIMDFWIRVNGSDVANSNDKITVTNGNDIRVLPMGGFILTLTAGQYIEFWMSGNSTDLSVITYAAGVTPTRPVTPSAKFTLTKIHP